MADKKEKKVTRESFEKRFRDFAPLAPFQKFIKEGHIDYFFRIYESLQRELSNFREMTPRRVERGISDGNKFMTDVERMAEELRLWVSAFEAKKLPWADSLAESILEEIKVFQQRIRQNFDDEKHMMRLRKSYLGMRPQRFGLHAFTAALYKFINREIEVPPGVTREEFTNLLIAGVMVGTTMITPIEAKQFDESTRGRIRQQIYNARQWDRNNPLDEIDVVVGKRKRRRDKTTQKGMGAREGRKTTRGKKKPE
jgi:hypothetical protein